MINGKKLVIGEHYRLAYLNPWNDIEIKEVKVAAITKEESVGSFSSDSIYSMYYGEYNIGLANYVSQMSSNPDIYILNEIGSKDPIDVDDKPIVIPEIIIDFDNSESLITCDHIDIKLLGIDKKFTFASEQGDYIETLTRGIINAAKSIPEIGDLPTSVDLTLRPFIQDEDTYNSSEGVRVHSHDLIEKAAIEERVKGDKRFRAIVSKINDLVIQEDNVERIALGIGETKTTLGEKLLELETELTNVQSLKDDVNLLFAGLEDGSLIVGSTDYQDLKDVIAGYANNE